MSSLLQEKTLDVTALKETGARLTAKVIEIIKNDYSKAIYVPLPDVLLVTVEQYDSLVDQDELDFMHDYSELADRVTLSKQKLFRTPHNVMEVRIKGGDYATETSKDNIVRETTRRLDKDNDQIIL